MKEFHHQILQHLVKKMEDPLVIRTPSEPSQNKARTKKYVGRGKENVLEGGEKKKSLRATNFRTTAFSLQVRTKKLQKKSRI